MLDIHYICTVINQGECAEKTKLAYTDKFKREIANLYKLSQAADLICTVEAIAQKTILTKSEIELFHSNTAFQKNIYKNIVKKKL